YEGTVSGRFHVTGSGSDAATMTLDGGGRLSEARLFGGRLRDAEVGVEIADGSLSGRYAGRFDDIHLAQAFADARVDAVLSGAGRAAIRVDGLLVRTVTLEDYTIEGQADLHSSTAGGIDISRGTFDARLAGARAHVTRLDLEGPAFEGTGSGDLVFEEGGSSRFDFDLARVDLGRLAPDGPVSSGLLSATGRMTGDLQRPRVNGTGRVSRVTAGNIDVLSGQFDYDATIPIDDPHEATVRFSGNASPLTVGSQVLSEVSFAGSYDRHAMALDLRGTRAGGSTPGIDAALVARGRLDVRARTVELDTLDATVQGVPWHLARGTTARMRWRDEGVTVDALALADRDTGRQRIAITGDWGATPGATLHVTANGVYLDTFSGAMSSPARYGGRLDADAYIRRAGSDTTIVTGLFTITDGRIRRLPFDRLLATVTYDDGRLKVDARLDQAPGAWLTAVGTVPLSLFVEGQPDLPMQLAIASSPIDLGLIEGVTDVVRNVSGRLTINLTAAGSGRDPHFEGGIDLANAAFSVRATGARYRNGRLAARLTRDRVDVTALHVEDGEGHTLDVTGSLGTHELKVGDLAVDAQARDFEVLRNEFGTTRVDATLHLQGQFESPRLTGTLAITGGELNVDEILDRVLMRPYATEAAAEATAEEELDALQALNPWERLGLDIAVNSRGTLRMVGSNVQVSSGTPLGLGNVNVRAYGEVYLYKDPADQLFVTGSLDSLVGTYAFQGRRFELDPSSSIVFRGDVNPELYVTVTREISGVQARVSIVGPLSEPELRLSSTPQLDDSNILSLIVFNANINDLSALQQQELAVRAGTLAAGFLATPLVTALERSLGLDILEIETGAVAGGTPKVTIGDEIAPGLVARFSRQFGQQEYNEASLEYYLSRLFRIRATFSDAGATMARSTFRRVERAGIDLLVFFSF
ncbi:MAG: translocation/assembly module TamB domain-containing protein, partial [Vicinamibacterales bacterium]